MSVYRNDNPDHFAKAVKSIYVDQTLKPDEIILVIDGPIPENLSLTINTLCNEIEILKPLWQSENKGLGIALQIGMQHVSNELVARMDADDISLPDRFEKQVNFMSENPDISICGGQISEFIDSETNIVAHRYVPLTPEECKKYYRDRDPLNHMSVMFRKSAVLAAGNYKPWHLDEDTYLWGRMLKNGCKIANLPDILVNVRVGEQMYARRGGWKYFKSDAKILKWKLDQGLTNRSRYAYNYIVRFIIQVLIPNSVRGWIFKKFLRTK